MAEQGVPDQVVTDALTLARSLGAISSFRAESTERGRRLWRITISPGNVVRFTPAQANAFALGAMSALRARMERENRNGGV